MTTVAAQILSLAPMPALLFAAMNDVASRRVPNWVPALVVTCGLGARLASGDLLPSIGLALAVFIALFACWRRGWLGGGDVKLLAACTVLVPAYAVPDLMLAIALAGGVLSAVYLLGRRAAGQPAPCRSASSTRTAPPMARLRRICRIEGWRIRRHASLPYACAIAAGCLFTLVAG